jgi:hypothetical protein
MKHIPDIASSKQTLAPDIACTSLNFFIYPDGLGFITMKAVKALPSDSSTHAYAERIGENRRE